MGPDLGVLVARVCVMAAQQGVDGTDGLLMEEENTEGRNKEISKKGFKNRVSSVTAF